jgi:sulfonate transport system substrate-binding protein
MLTRRRFAADFVATSALTLSALSAPHIARAQDQPKKIRIGIAEAGLGGRPYSFGDTVSVVHVQGLLEREFSKDGTAIEWHFYAGAGPAVNEALANNALDFVWQGDLPQYVARSRGLDTRQLWVDGNRLPVYVAVSKKSSITDLAGLKGKTVANFQGTSLELSVDRILASVNLTEADLQIINLDQITATQAVIEGQIDATFLAFGLPPQAAKMLRVIYHAGADNPAFTQQASALTTGAFAAAYPDAVARVAKVQVNAAHWASLPENTAALYDIWGKSGYPVPMLKAIYQITDLKQFTSPLWDPFQLAQMQRSAADAFKYGLIRTAVDTTHWIDHAPLDGALAASGLTHYWPQFAADGTTRLV